MLIKCNDSDIKKVINYIGEDRTLCFYMYMDIIECGTEDEGLGLWISENNDNIDMVCYIYFDCLHVFSRQGCVVSEVIKLINDIDPKVIVGNENDISEIEKELKENRYTYELNHIITADIIMHSEVNVDVQLAKEDDIPEIATLMMKDHIYYSVYSYDKLCDDLRRRFREGFGRLFVVRDSDNRIIATNATNAETDDLAVIGGLVTDPDMRGRGLGRSITASTWNLIRREGKQGLAFLLSDNINTINLHKKMGFEFIGKSARLVKND